MDLGIEKNDKLGIFAAPLRATPQILKRWLSAGQLFDHRLVRFTLRWALRFIFGTTCLIARCGTRLLNPTHDSRNAVHAYLGAIRDCTGDIEGAENHGDASFSGE